MSFSDISSQPQLAELLQVLKKKEAIVIAGTGVSANVVSSNALIRSWPKLLRHGIDFCCQHCNDTEDISSTSRLFDYTKSVSLDELLEIGDEIQHYLEKNKLMTKWLESVFSNLLPEDQRLIRALEKLRVPIATTNYDRLFENITGLPGISWRDTTRLHYFLNGKDQAILHLHGHFQDSESIILGRRSYNALLEAEFAQFVEQSLFSRYNVIFVGFGESTKDPNFNRLLTWSQKYLSATKVFRLIQESEIDKLQAEHKALGYNIQLISYGTDYSDLAPFLEELTYQLPIVAPIPANLPAPPDNVGRGDFIEELVEKLVDLSGKPVAVLGGAGIGKSNSILNGLYHPKVAIQYGERRYFVRCDGATTPEFLWTQALETLGLQPVRDSLPQQQIEHFLNQESTLLVFDNAETPWENFSTTFENIVGRLKTLSNLRLVITYRGKTVPGIGTSWDSNFVPALTKEQARSLFINLTTNEFSADPVILRLVQAVDYLPLAITLLAERAKDYSQLIDLEKKWQQRKTDLLKLDPTNKDLNLEVSVLLSFDSPRISDIGRELFKVLCWLPDGIQRGDWEEAFPDHEDDQNALIRVALAYEDRSSRLRVLAPIREVISRKFVLTTSWLELSIHKIIDTISENSRQISCDETAFARIQMEWINLNRIFKEWTLTKRLIKTLTDLTVFSSFSGLHLTDSLVKSIDTAKTNQWTESQAHCLLSLGCLNTYQRNYEASVSYYQQAQLLYEQIGDIDGKANCLKGVGDVSFSSLSNETDDPNFFISQTQIAVDHYRQAHVLYDQIGNTAGIARCLQGLGDVAFFQMFFNQGSVDYKRSHSENSVIYYQKAQPLYEQVGDMLGKANCLKGLGDVAFTTSDQTQGDQFYEKAIQLYRRINASYFVGLAYYHWSLQSLNPALWSERRYQAEKAWDEIGWYDLKKTMNKSLNIVQFV